MQSDSERFPGSTYDLTYMCTQKHACTSVCINKHTRKSLFICLFDEHWKQNTGWNVINQINNSEKDALPSKNINRDSAIHSKLPSSWLEEDIFDSYFLLILQHVLSFSFHPKKMNTGVDSFTSMQWHLWKGNCY